MIGHVKSDHYMDRNMLAGERGDRINAMLAGLGFYLVKLMKGLARLFLCLRTEIDGFADFLLSVVRLVMCDAAVRLVPVAVLRGDPKLLKSGFA